ncbi:MAG: hypothetical protein ABWK01_02835 [Infirmifilum sp.]
MSSRDYKFEVPLLRLEEPLPVDKTLVEQLSKAVSRKMLNQMKREAVDCPVLGKQVSFLQCFGCKNFVRRVRGVVYCRGEPL